MLYLFIYRISMWVQNSRFGHKSSDDEVSSIHGCLFEYAMDLSQNTNPNLGIQHRNRLHDPPSHVPQLRHCFSAAASPTSGSTSPAMLTAVGFEPFELADLQGRQTASYEDRLQGRQGDRRTHVGMYVNMLLCTRFTQTNVIVHTRNSPAPQCAKCW